MSARRTVVFVLCPGHSGSTLLGHFLGAHPAALHVGEVVAPMRRGRPFVCRVCESEPCPVWGSLLTEPVVRRALRQYRRDRFIPEALRTALARLGREDPRGDLHRRLLAGLPDVHVVVDSSKTLPWALWNRAGLRDARVVLLHLRRDLRGVLASQLGRSEAGGIEEVARSIAAQTRRIQAELRRADPADVCSVHYEELVADPAGTGAQLCAALGLDFEPAMLDYYKVPQHVIGGNAGPTFQVRRHLGRTDAALEFLDRTSEENQRFYRERRPGFVADLRWKHKLSPQMLDVFERVAGEANRSLGYPLEEPAGGAERTNSRST